MPEAARDNWQAFSNAELSIATPVCVDYEMRPGSGDIHTCWFHFDALAQASDCQIERRHAIRRWGVATSKLHNHYQICLPFAWCTTIHLRCIDITRLSFAACGMSSHSSWGVGVGGYAQLVIVCLKWLFGCELPDQGRPRPFLLATNLGNMQANQT